MKEIYHVQRSKNENWLRCQLSQNWSSESMQSQSSTLFLPIVITIDLLSLFHVKTKVTEACFCVYGSGKKKNFKVEWKENKRFISKKHHCLGRGQKGVNSE